MGCTHPLLACSADKGKRVTFARPRNFTHLRKMINDNDYVYLPCRKCVSCRLQNGRD